MKVSLRALVKVLNPPPKKWSGRQEGEAAHLTTHADSVTSDSLFVAIRGNSVDGHHFLPELLSKKPAVLVVEDPSSIAHLIDQGTTALLVVENTRKALAQLSALFYQFPWKNMDVVGITGTNGKTTTTYLCESIARSAGKIPAIMGTIETRCGDWMAPSKLTTPAPPRLHELITEIAEKGATHLFAEVSSHALDQFRFYAIDISVAAFTNLTQDHLDYHHSMEHYFGSKARLFTEYLPDSTAKYPTAVINLDDPWGKLLVKKIPSHCRLLTYALDAEDASVKVLQYELSLKGIRAAIRIPQGLIEIRSSLIGQHNLSNIACAAAIASALEFSADRIVEGISHLKGVPGRLEGIEEGQSFGVFVDYAHTDDALHGVLTALRTLSSKSRVITVFGCGGDRDPKKRPLMAKAVSEMSDYAIITSDNPRTESPKKIILEILGGLPPHFREGEHWRVIEDRRGAIETALSLAKGEDVVLIAGKGHEAYQIIGKKTLPFDDREVARGWLRRRFRYEG
ncbi:MAG: UDP-N-acetylmuramoyl-L-alanyl-D-glutamate--2,6-diaminopimelate ligase [Deltaproteobacteria bacterium]|nr:UDP-N-acetylmuramoyl-L-alanyl-D-glutamate--2,6-diaminopimelate ligase [Deltaproteobacteria bacterium]